MHQRWGLYWLYNRKILIVNFYLIMFTTKNKSVRNQGKRVTPLEGGIFLLYGYGGTRKTFLRKTLFPAIWSQGTILFKLASNGIASLLLSGRRITHSKFKIPIPTLEHSICNIEKGSNLAYLLKKSAYLIIRAEATMAHKYCLETLHGTLNDIMKSNKKSNSALMENYNNEMF